MVDANQAFNRVEALRRGRVYQELGCFWYEEPLPPYDHEGYAELAQALDIRIATGENDYNKRAFMDLMLRKGVDVVQPDNRRAGGPCEWMEIGAIADGFGLELASHGGGPDQPEHAVRHAECDLHGDFRPPGTNDQRRSPGPRNPRHGPADLPGLHQEVQDRLILCIFAPSREIFAGLEHYFSFEKSVGLMNIDSDFSTILPWASDAVCTLIQSGSLKNAAQEAAAPARLLCFRM